MYRWIVLLFAMTHSFNVSGTTNLTALEKNGIQQWEPKVFSGKSTYTIKNYKGRLALKAVSEGSASGLGLKKRIDLDKTPYINWSWLIERQLTGLDERSKNGDDFVARIYVVIDGGLMIWKSKSLNYVWSSNQSQGLVWDNAFAGARIKMMSVKGSQARRGEWFKEKRNVYRDLILTFGDKGSEIANQKAYRYIDIVAIMTDTDNSDGEAESYYGDIVFSRR